MIDIQIVIGVAIAAVITAVLLVTRPRFVKKGPVRPKSDKVRQLETQLKMVAGLDVVDVLSELADAYRVDGRIEECERTYRDLLAAVEREVGDQDPLLVPILEKYSKVLQGMEHTAEARVLRERARAINEAQGRPRR